MARGFRSNAAERVEAQADRAVRALSFEPTHRTALAVLLLTTSCATTPRAARHAVATPSIWLADSLAYYCGAEPIAVDSPETVIVQFTIMPSGIVDPPSVLLYESSSRAMSRWVRRVINRCRFNRILMRASTEEGATVVSYPIGRVWRVVAVPAANRAWGLR